MTGPWIFIAICCAGGLGAAMRFVLDGVIRARSQSPLPVATILINISGAFVLGLLTALAAKHHMSHSTFLILGGGVMGGYTTFSTACLETVRLADERHRWYALANAGGTVVVATMAAWIAIHLA